MEGCVSIRPNDSIAWNRRMLASGNSWWIWPSTKQSYRKSRRELISSARRREAVECVHQRLHVSKRRACRVLQHCRATQRYVPQPADDEERLRTRIIEVARAYGPYGYRRITALLRREGWLVNHKRVERTWWEEALLFACPLFGGAYKLNGWLNHWRLVIPKQDFVSCCYPVLSISNGLNLYSLTFAIHLFRDLTY